MSQISVYANRMRLTVLKNDGGREQQLYAFEVLLDESKLGDLVYRASVNKSRMCKLGQGTFTVKVYPPN